MAAALAINQTSKLVGFFEPVNQFSISKVLWSSFTKGKGLPGPKIQFPPPKGQKNLNCY
jgi:hypothetical protein